MYFAGIKGGKTEEIGEIGVCPLFINAATISTIKSGDVLFFENSGDIGGFAKALMAVFDPGSFSHTGIGVGKGEIADSEVELGKTPSGPNVRKLDSLLYKDRRFKRIEMGESLGVTAREIAVKHADNGVRFDLLGKNGIFCSKLTKEIYKESHQTGTYGLGPNSQYSFMDGKR